MLGKSNTKMSVFANNKFYYIKSITVNSRKYRMSAPRTFSYRLSILISLLFSGWGTLSYAQEYTFKHYSSSDAINPLTGNSSFSITQDELGLMWIGMVGGGILRYDGNTMRQYRGDDPFMQGLDFTTSMYRTPDDRIWIRINSNLRVTTNPVSSNGFPVEPVFTDSLKGRDGYFKLWEGSSLAYGRDAYAIDPYTGGHWAATGSHGVIHIMQDTDGYWRADTLNPASFIPNAESDISDVYSVLVRQNGELVFVTRNGFIVVLDRDDIHAWLDGNPNDYISFRRFNDPASVGVHISLMEDKNGKLYSGTTTGNIWTFSGDLKTAIHDSESPFVPEHMYNIGRVMVYQLVQDTRGYVWAGTSNGLGYMQPEKNKQFRFISGLPKVGFNVLFVDREGNIWGGSHDGIYKFRSNFDSFVLLQHEDVSETKNLQVQSIAIDSLNNKMIWMATQKGIITATETPLGYEYDQITLDFGDLDLSFSAISTHQDGSVWAGLNRGFVVITPTGQNESSPLTNFEPTHIQHLSNNRIFYYFDHDNSTSEIWHGTFNGKSVSIFRSVMHLYSVVDGEFTVLGKVINEPRPGLGRIMLDKYGYIWVGTHSYGLVKSKLTIEELLEEPEVILFQDAEKEFQISEDLFEQVLINDQYNFGSLFNFNHIGDEILVGTGLGLLRFVEANEHANRRSWVQTTTLTVEDGLNHIYPSTPFLDEEAGIIWIGGPAGLNAIDLETFTVIASANRMDGMHEEFLYHSRAMTQNPEYVFYGTAQGAIRVNKENVLNQAAIQPSVVITSHDLQQSRNGKNRLQVNFSAPSFISDPHSTFLYRMANYDREWINAGSSTTSTYTNLRAFAYPKTYQFEVKSVNQRGLQSAEPAILSILINPPWYFHWLFLLITLGGFLLLFITFLRYRDFKKQEKQKEEELRKQFEITQRIGASIAHDMKNSVFSLSFLSRNLEKRFDNPDFRADAIETLKNTTSHLNGLIQKFQEQKYSWDVTLNKADFKHTVSSVIKKFKVENQAKYTFGFDAPESVQWMHDAHAIERIIENLFKNAIEAMPGGGNIDIRIQESSKTLKLSIKDHGTGISEEFLKEKLFEPFNSTKKQGLGLGMYSVAKLTEAHNGKVYVTSTVGKGTEFTLEFHKK